MATVLDDLSSLLATNFPSETIRKGYLPTGDNNTAPDKVIALREPIGTSPPAETFVGRGKGPKINVEIPFIQILCRSDPDDYQGARDLADNIFKTLHNQSGIDIDGTRYLLIEAAQSPYNLGIDEQGRYVIGFNIKCWKVPNS